MAIFGSPAKTGHSKKDIEKRWPALKGSRIALGAGTVLVLSLLLSMHLLPDKVTLQVGDTSNVELKAHRAVRYVDSVETERLRDEAAARVGKVYLPKPASDANEDVSNVFDILRRARADGSLRNVQAKSQYVRHNLRMDLGLSKDALTVLLSADDRTFERLRSYTVQLAREIMDLEIRDDTNDTQEARTEFRRRIGNYLGNATYAKAVSEIGGNVITPNRIYDPDSTKKAQERERALVPMQYRQLVPGEILIEPGQRVTPANIDEFTALGLSRPQADYVMLLCIVLLIACVVTFVVIYLARYHQHVYRSDKLLLLLSLIVVVSLLFLNVGGSVLKLKLSGAQFDYYAMIWISAAGMLTAALIDSQLAVLVVALLASISGLVLNDELRWALAALLSSLVAIYSVSDIRHRSDLVPAVVAVCTANLAMVWLIGRISGDAVSDLLVGSGWAVAGGMLSIMIFWFGAIALEKPFGITTHNRLVELSDTHSPMLKRLLMEAPGTCSHSLSVGTIASTAADLIGADALLVRVASYYHDIGKIKRPHFFVENQHVENVHDHLNPSLSALVIRSHIKDGLELAREYNLPPLVCELMSQHHGTSLVRYFYCQAANDASNSSPMLEQQFRYDGTKPQSKESALLMIADSVEAASRAMSRPTPGQIEDLVEKIIAEKLADGQLDESELTFKDISRIRESFIRTLTSMMHARIEYPELPSEVKKANGNGSPNKEQPAEEGGSGKSDRGGQEIAAS
jgi:putative nucleotidyltransferase with HDIG domain